MDRHTPHAGAVAVLERGRCAAWGPECASIKLIDYIVSSHTSNRMRYDHCVRVGTSEAVTGASSGRHRVTKRSAARRVDGARSQFVLGIGKSALSRADAYSLMTADSYDCQLVNLAPRGARWQRCIPGEQMNWFKVSTRVSPTASILMLQLPAGFTAPDFTESASLYMTLRSQLEVSQSCGTQADDTVSRHWATVPLPRGSAAVRSRGAPGSSRRARAAT